MKRSELLWIIALLVSTILITCLSLEAMKLKDEVDQLQQENRLLTDEIWILNQHLMEVKAE